MTKCSSTAKGEEDLRELQGSTLKLNMKFVWRVSFRTEEPHKQAGYLRRSWFLVIIISFLQMSSCVGRIAPQPSHLDTTARTECPVGWAEPWTCQCWCLDRQSLLVFGLDEGFDSCAIAPGKPTSLGFPICKYAQMLEVMAGP